MTCTGVINHDSFLSAAAAWQSYLLWQSQMKWYWTSHWSERIQLCSKLFIPHASSNLSLLLFFSFILSCNRHEFSSRGRCTLVFPVPLMARLMYSIEAARSGVLDGALGGSGSLCGSEYSPVRAALCVQATLACRPTQLALPAFFKVPLAPACILENPTGRLFFHSQV